MFKKIVLFTCLISFLGAINCEFHNVNKSPQSSEVLRTLKDVGNDVKDVVLHPVTLSIAGSIGAIYLLYKLNLSSDTLNLIGASLHLANLILITTKIVNR